MMEEVSSEDTNGDSTFEFVGDSLSNSQTNEMSTISPPICSGPDDNVQLETSLQLPSAPPMPPPPISLPVSLTPVLPTNTQTITSIPGGPICYAPLPSYDALSVPTATIDLSGVSESVGPSPAFQSLTDSSQGGLWGWFKQSEILNKFAEKAKNSVDTMITTLDPGMKEIIYSGGDVSILVANDCDWVLSAIRDTFQLTFGRATVEGCPEPTTSGAPQPVGFSAGVKNAEEKCHFLRANGTALEHQAVLSIQSILLEATPEKWFEVTCLVLQNPVKRTFLQAFTQATAVPDEYVARAQDATPADYPLRWSGLAITLDQAAGSDHWSEDLTGVNRREILLLAARSLAGSYKASL